MERDLRRSSTKMFTIVSCLLAVSLGISGCGLLAMHLIKKKTKKYKWAAWAALILSCTAVFLDVMLMWYLYPTEGQEIHHYAGIHLEATDAVDGITRATAIANKTDNRVTSADMQEIVTQTTTAVQQALQQHKLSPPADVTPTPVASREIPKDYVDGQETNRSAKFHLEVTDAVEFATRVAAIANKTDDTVTQEIETQTSTTVTHMLKQHQVSPPADVTSILQNPAELYISSSLSPAQQAVMATPEDAKVSTIGRELHAAVSAGRQQDQMTLDGPSFSIVPRREWIASPPKSTMPLKHPVEYVIIAHTATAPCATQAECTVTLKYLQLHQAQYNSWMDIAYNFIVSGDGQVYEGRGWNVVGAHTMGFNTKSVGIAFVGVFHEVLPPPTQIRACKLLIEEGVRLGKISPNYKLVGHRQVSPSESPGKMLFEELKTWDHWAPDVL